MAEGDVHTVAFQPCVKIAELFCLDPGFSQIFTVCCGKVAEQALGIQIRQPRDLGAKGGIFFGGLEAQAAHACIHRKMEGGSNA